MPVFHIIIHTYRSWHEDNERGYVQRGDDHHQPNPSLAEHRNRSANGPEVRLVREQMDVALDAVNTTCDRKGWRAHAGAVTCTHVHAVVSWDQPLSEDEIEAGLKSGIGYCLSKNEGTTGNRWFSRGGRPERVKDHAHLHHLIHDYLPKHAMEQGGVYRNFDEERKLEREKGKP